MNLIVEDMNELTKLSYIGTTLAHKLISIHINTYKELKETGAEQALIKI